MKVSIEKVLGRKSDSRVAEEYGMHVTQVYRLRHKLGIPSYKPAYGRGGNNTANRGHRALGKSTNLLTPDISDLLTDLRRFFAEHKRGAGIANPYSRARCSRETGISDSSLRHYIAGRYVPCLKAVIAMRTWLTNARADAARRTNN